MSTIEHAPLREGDRVRIDFGRRKLAGVIVENRGAIGVRGRQLFRVEIAMDPHEPMIVELPEDELEPIGESLEKPPLDKAKVIDYLVSGGLIAILRSNRGGKNQPRVWLCADNVGNVTHTFIPERGQLGGQTVPPGTVQDDKIFTPKRESVVAFVESFGLNRREAERVVTTVSTVP